ncbi:MAG: glycerol-3-phosphate 1-O-acyltransferase PlsY [Phycisphaerae bacterium]
MNFALFVVSAYLVGAIPFGVWIARGHGVDIRAHGSGNIGATNVGRVLGRKWGLLCLALDVLKGLLPTLAAKFVLLPPAPDATDFGRWLLIASAAVLGHVFPIYLGFRGGKGVATTVGVGLGIYPFLTVPMLAAVGGYAVVRFTTGWVSAGSITMAVAFPAFAYAYARLTALSLDRAWPLLAAATGLGVLIIARHHANIRRIFAGTEKRVA